MNAIAQEAWQAIREAGIELGGAPLQVTFVKAGVVSGPANDPTFGSPTNHTMDALVDSFRMELIDQKTIKSSDRLLMVAAVYSAAPEEGDTALMQGKRYNVEIVKPFMPAGQAIYYEVLLRN